MFILCVGNWLYIQLTLNQYSGPSQKQKKKIQGIQYIIQRRTEIYRRGLLTSLYIYIYIYIYSKLIFPSIYIYIIQIGLGCNLLFCELTT
jgi:hypothetical protein